MFVSAQLFKKPHPQKKLSLRGGLPAAATQLGFFVSSAANDRLFFHNLDNLRPSMQPLKGEHYSVLYSAVTASNLPSVYTPNINHQMHFNVIVVEFWGLYQKNGI